MKKIVSLMAMIAISLAANAVRPYSLTNIWAEVEAYPTGAGKVYITSNDAKPLSESGWGETSESHFTIGKSGETTHYNVVNGTFEPYYIPRFYGIIQVAPEDGYDCVGLVKRIDESGSYSDEDYYYGGPATYNKIADLHAYDRPMDATYEKIGFVGENGMDVDMNSGRDGKYETQDILTEEEKKEIETLEVGEEDYYYYHDRVVERGPWPAEPTKIYALFKEKVRVTLDDKGEAVFSSADNLKLQEDNGLKAYVAYKVVNGKGLLKETDSIPARLGVLLKGEPGQTYTFDRIPEPQRLTITNSQGTKTYNALLCEIFGFYPESEILYMYGNYEYGEGFYQVNSWYTPSSNYLTVAIAGGSPATFFTIDALPTGIESVHAGGKEASNEVFDLQGRRHNDFNTLPKGIYIKDGKKIVKK